MRFVKTYWLEMLMVIPLFAYLMPLPEGEAQPGENAEAAARRIMLEQVGVSECELRQLGHFRCRATSQHPTLPNNAITYQVLRASSATALPTPVTLAPIGNRQYTDRNLENEQTYFYSVQAVRADVGSVAVGEPSSPIALTPRKMTPPAPPSGLIAIASADAVRLAWEASPEADVAGYVIYRAAGNGDMVRIARVTVPTTVFVDRAVAAGPYRYAVSAFDRASRPNESGRSAEVRVTVR